MNKKSHQTINIDCDFGDKYLVIQEQLEQFGFVILESPKLLSNIFLYFSQAQQLFQHLSTNSLPQAYHLQQNQNQGYYGIHLPLGIENVSSQQSDQKAIFDLFPKTSYSYNYYQDLNLISDDAINFDCQTYQDLLWWSDQCLNCLQEIMEHLASQYHFHQRLITKTNWLTRIIHYPPTLADDSLRLAAHTDDDFLAMVVAEDYSGLEILEIKDRNDLFSKISIPPNCFLVLSGKCLEYLTQGKIHGLCHRVVGGANYHQHRYVFNFNIGANLDETLISNYYQNILKDKYFLNLAKSVVDIVSEI